MALESILELRVQTRLLEEAHAPHDGGIPPHPSCSSAHGLFEKYFPNFSDIQKQTTLVPNATETMPDRFFSVFLIFVKL